MAKVIELEPRPFRNAAEILAEIETEYGGEAAVLAAAHMIDAAGNYLIRNCGAAWFLDELLGSTKIADALALEMARRN